MVAYLQPPFFLQFYVFSSKYACSRKINVGQDFILWIVNWLDHKKQEWSQVLFG